MHFLPGNGLVSVISLSEFFNPWTIGFDCLVAVDTHIQTGYQGVTADLHPGMAIAAVYLIITRMKLVRERDGLIGLIAFVVKQADFVIGQKINKQGESGKKDKEQ